MYHVYILEDCSNSYFVGITNDFKTKLEEHKRTFSAKGEDCNHLKVRLVEYFQDAIRAISKFRELDNLPKRRLKAKIQAAGMEMVV